MPKPTSLASAPRSATWLCSRSSSSSSARTSAVAARRTPMPSGILDGHGVGERVADGGVPADSLRELHAVRRVERPRRASPCPGGRTTAGPSSAGWSPRPPRTGSGPARSARRAPDRPGSRRPPVPSTCEEGEGADVRGGTAGAVPASRRIGYQPARPVARAAPAAAAAGDRGSRCRTGRASPARTGPPGGQVEPGWAPTGPPAAPDHEPRALRPRAGGRRRRRGTGAVLVRRDQGQPVPLGEQGPRRLAEPLAAPGRCARVGASAAPVTTPPARRRAR